MATHSLGLKDGRTLEIEVSGPEAGAVCVFHHGTPGSALQVELMTSAAHVRGLRLVTYSRAGYAGSSRRPGRSVSDVAADIAEVLDHLGADDCVTFGWSGGGPHALATAALLPQRVRAVSSVAGVKPYTSFEDFTAGMGEDNIEEFGAAVDGEAALRPMIEAATAEMGSLDLATLVGQMSSILPEVDKQAMARPAGSALIDMAFGRLGSGDGWLDDDLAFCAPWGFELDQVSAPAFVWQGSADLMVPASHAPTLAAGVPGAVLHQVDGAGHISLMTDHLDEILDELVSAL